MKTKNMKKGTILFLMALAILSCSKESSDKTEGKEKVETNAEKPTYYTYTWAGELAPYPSPQAVVKQFLRIYDASVYENNTNLLPLLSRRPEGWYIQAREFYGDTSMSAHLFYSIDDSSYQEIPFKERSYGSNVDTESLSAKWINQTNQSFKGRPRDHLYFGYDDFKKDFLNRFSISKNIDDGLLLNLVYAHGIWSDTNSYSLNMSSPMIKEFEGKYQKAQEAMEKLAKRNPDFETLIGSAKMKLANDYLDQWYRGSTFKDNPWVNQILKANYSEEVIAFAKSYLSSCAQNAILFTFGDNDTYPLLYVQEALNYRQDVAVVNLSLLLHPRHFAQLKRDDLGYPPIRHSLEAKDIATEELQKSITVSASNPNNFFNKLKNFERSTGGAILFPADSKALPTLWSEYAPFHDLVVDEMNIQLSNTNDIQSYILADLIAGNINDRPIYFAITVPHSSYSSYRSYLNLEGMAFRITPFDFNDANTIPHPDLTFNNWMKDLDLFTNLKAKSFYPIEEVRFYATLLNVLSLAIERLEPINPPKAKELLAKCFSVMPLKELLNDEDFGYGANAVTNTLNLARELDVIEDYQYEIDVMTNYFLHLAHNIDYTSYSDYRFDSRYRKKNDKYYKLSSIDKFLSFAIGSGADHNGLRYVSSLSLDSICFALLSHFSEEELER